jgi:hypothetical protein
MIGIGVAALVADVANAQHKPAGSFKTCSEAHWACLTRHRLPTECETEKRWCLQSGTFADPVTKTVSMGLQKK